jgi:hypothetical protein
MNNVAIIILFKIFLAIYREKVLESVSFATYA